MLKTINALLLPLTLLAMAGCSNRREPQSVEASDRTPDQKAAIIDAHKVNERQKRTYAPK